MRWWVAVAALWVCGPWLAFFWQRRKAQKRDEAVLLSVVQQRAKQDAAERLSARIAAGESVTVDWDS